MRLPSPQQLLEFPQSVRLALKPMPGETLDAICGGEVQVLQRRAGYRFSLDPILLAHFAVFEAGAHRGRLIDLGTGSGIIPLVLAKRLGLRDVTGLELQPRLYALAERNVYLNRCEQQVTLVQGDLRQVSQFFAAGSFGHVLCNPPYRACTTGRSSMTLEKALARHEVACSLQDVAGAARHLLTPRGGLSLVYPSARFAELVAVLREHRLEPKTVRMVHPRAERPAKLVLLHAVKGGRADLRVLPPLVLHAEDEHAFTEEVSAMVG